MNDQKHSTNKSSLKYFYGTGRRKTSVARVRIYNKKGDSTINGKIVNLDDEMQKPFEITGLSDSFYISAKVLGGGWSSQIEAIRHGIARALESFNPTLRSTLKKAGYLSRDPREKERKKPGLKKARKAAQWSKR